MTATEIDRELEDLLREALSAVADATPVLDGRVARRSSHRMVPVAAAAVVIAGVTGVATVIVRDRPSAPEAATTQPTGTEATTIAAAGSEPDFLAPRPGLPGLDVAGVTAGVSPPAFYEGAIRAPNGVVVGFTVQEGPLQGLDPGVASAGEEWREIGNLLVAGGLPEGDEVGFDRYVLESGCIMAALTTSAGVERWAPELVEVIEAMTIVDGAVTVALPAEWTSLGSGGQSAFVTTEFSANIGSGGRRDFMLQQRPDTSVGVHLANPQGRRPIQAQAGSTVVWLLGESGGGWRTVVFDHEGTAVALSARDVTDAQLLIMVTNLVEQPWSEIDGSDPPPSMPATSEPEPADAAGETQPECAISVEIVEAL